MNPIIGVILVFLIYLSITKAWIKFIESLFEGVQHYFCKLLHCITNNKEH